MQVIYGDILLDISTVRNWAKTCKKEGCGKAVLNDQPQSGRPLTATNKSHQDHVDELIHENRHIEQKEIVEALGISKQ